MAFSKGSAIARYKAAARKIRRDRKRGVTIETPGRNWGKTAAAHLASGKPAALQAVSGEWFVWNAPQAGPPFRNAALLAGPFDSRAEAEAWIAECKL